MAILVLRVTGTAGRLDRYLADHCPDLSRSLAQRLIREGRVCVNGSVPKASYFPLVGDRIRVELPQREPHLPVAQRMPLNIVFEDEYLLVVDKPAGLVVHPGPGHVEGTLVNALLAHRPDLAEASDDPMRPGIVHRLDRETSGLLVVAATPRVQAALQGQFKSRLVEKGYLVLVYGHLCPEVAAIEAPIGRDPQQRSRMRVVSEGGRYARTEYQVREFLPECTYAEVRLLTGRTHQVRVHFASIGHAVVGDRVYGYRQQRIATPRHLLHAWKLGFTHPVTQELLSFRSEPPEDFSNVVRSLRGDDEEER